MTPKATDRIVVPPPLPKGARPTARRKASPAVWRNGAWRSPEAVQRIILRERLRARVRRAAGRRK